MENEHTIGLNARRQNFLQTVRVETEQRELAQWLSFYESLSTGEVEQLLTGKDQSGRAAMQFQSPEMMAATRVWRSRTESDRPKLHARDPDDNAPESWWSRERN